MGENKTLVRELLYCYNNATIIIMLFLIALLLLFIEIL